MNHILLINPNSSEATTSMMLAIAEAVADRRVAVAGATAARSPSMITTPSELARAADEVVEIGTRHGAGCIGIIIAAFGDPGLEELRRRVSVPVTGICEASMLEAAEGGRRFSVATTTPDLLEIIDQQAARLGLAGQYRGTRCTAGDPRALTGNVQALNAALGEAVGQCFETDGAEAVIIGGGPLGQAAEALKGRFARPVLSPVASAVRALLGRGEGMKPDRTQIRGR